MLDIDVVSADDGRDAGAELDSVRSGLYEALTRRGADASSAKLTRAR